MCNVMVYASLVLGCIAMAGLTAAAPPAVTEKKWMDLKEKSLCPIDEDYEEVIGRTPQRIKILRCANRGGTPNAHPLCRGEPKACCGARFGKYETECVDVTDVAYVLMEGSDQPEPHTVYVGCSCMIKETTAALDGDRSRDFRMESPHYQHNIP